MGSYQSKHVIYYVNKNLLGPLLSYNHDEKLVLAILFFVQKLRHYILIRNTKVIANSNPMLYLLNMQVIKSKVTWWIEILQEFDLLFATPKSKKTSALEIFYLWPSNKCNWCSS